ncbi:MAG: polyphenol oxidase family protein, partial [Chthoniobacterales bacterium]|nr:polyphenol oxidase family protein [Chthoniobacterales bacterium]
MSSRAPTPDSVVETFPALAATGVVRHGFVGRIPGLDVATERTAALERLDAAHRLVRSELDVAGRAFFTAEQVHGKEVAVIAQPADADRCFDGADGLVTNQGGVSLGIYVADCCAVFLVDPVRRAIGLVHSGKKGTELGIAGQAVALLQEHFDSAPRDLVAQLSPCIRPPHYEVDFAAEIARQLRAAGVEQVHDAGRCTACELQRYYSYRAEKARTGR